MPVKMIVGVLVVLLALPLYRERYVHHFGETLKALRQLIQALGGAQQR